ncbi:FAD-binding oxidoreductase [Actinoplanes sp. TBRC 11911]|uniref:FAD-dependent oxidoreductase n=1 Tax=Actinoplanes sp. TBRC 11911 TaxID=2729386 RepID=UPI00145E0D3D|nr:FAD-dependent oxidoreductase [Actinoplanes sp. TBRC 11911]NMO54693.1 FAD-binding oxidoreductase [Actinoplanes sp. TBRC 11911]
MADVVVVGGGIIGLTAARRLQQRGADVTIWTAHDVRDTVSSVAAAVWYPTHTDDDPRVRRWAASAYREFMRQADAGVPGVMVRHTRMVLRSPLAALPWWARSIGDAVLAGGELRFSAPLVEMDTYLAWLLSQLVDGGATVVRRRPVSLAAASAAAPIVVNATGLAARELCGDTAVYPVRGHIVLADNPGLVESVRDEDNPAGLTYVHPRGDDVVLGGTFEEGLSSVAPDPVEAAAIVRRCGAVVPELSGVRVRGSRIGLRPARRGGPRVEAEGQVIHAYGHGGAGVTLSWGCADDVASWGDHLA